MEKFILASIFLFLLVLLFRSPIPQTELEHKDLPRKTIEAKNQTDLALDNSLKTKTELLP